jgi:CubicO group peptidase (beta-lactamase class C family)
MKNKVAALISLVLIASAGNAQSRDRGQPGLDERIKRVENGLLPPYAIKGQPTIAMRLADRMKFYKTPGISVAVIDRGRIEWARGYGVSDSSNITAITPETLFQAGSISKPVAATAALRLVQQGVLGLDDPVNARLTSWKLPENQFTGGKGVTLRQLLSHTAGVSVHGFYGYAADSAVPTLLQVLDGRKPANSDSIRVDRRPGTEYSYSGGGYEIMQQLLIDVTGKRFPDLMQELVLKPIGMTHSSYEQPLPRDRWSQAAIGHGPDGQKVKGNWRVLPEMAAAGLWTTPSDLARFAIEIQNSLAGKSSKVLSEETTKQMLTPQVGGWGLGLDLTSAGASARFGHGGSNVGYRAVMIAYRNSGQGAVVMTNADQGSALADEVLRSIAREYGWSDYLSKELVLVHVDPKFYRAYVGQYELAPNFFLTVTSEEGRLLIQLTGQSKLEFSPESETKFFSMEAAAELIFVKDRNGQTTEVIYRQNDRDDHAKKVR